MIEIKKSAAHLRLVEIIVIEESYILFCIDMVLYSKYIVSNKIRNVLLL